VNCRSKCVQQRTYYSTFEKISIAHNDNKEREGERESRSVKMSKDDAMKAPFVSGMDKLAESQTVCLRQLTQFAEIFLPYEQQNKYMLSEVPSGVKAATSIDDPNAWHPTGTELRAQPKIYFGYEMSDFFTRCCYSAMKISNLRPFEFNFIPAYKEAELNSAGWANVRENMDVDGSGEGLRLKRPFKCGGCCGDPHVLYIRSANNETIGESWENFEPYGEKCNDACCKCTHYHDVYEKGTTNSIFSIQVGTCCCGPHNNCCGATCCQDNMVFDILKDGKVVANIQKIYGKETEGCLGAFCRMTNDFSNYIITFPPETSVKQKQLIMGAVMQIEYLYFSPNERDHDHNSGGYSGN